MVGAESVAKSAADGYTLLVIAVQHSVVPALYQKIAYDIERDFAPVALMANVPIVVTVRNTLQATSIPELMALARSKPGALNYASSGNGGATHLSAELFKRQARVDMTHVPYKGSGPAITDLIGGQVDLMFVDLPSAIAQIKAGKLRALGVASLQPTPLLPCVPPVASSGLPGYEAAAWSGIVAPAATPKEIVSRLNAEVAAALGRQDLKDLLMQQGAEAAPGTPEQFGAHLKSELEKWAGVVKSAGIKPD